MIFNGWDYYVLFLVPSAILFRSASERARPWVIFATGCLFFVYFSYTQLGGIAGAACLGIFLWESLVSRFHEPLWWICWAGVALAVLFLIIFQIPQF